MLEIQVRHWNQYPAELGAYIQIVLVDDASPDHPALPIFKECKLPKMLFKVDVNIPWHQHAARNIGSKDADPEQYLFMSDMDIVLPPEAACQIVGRELDPAKYYSFERAFAPSLTFRKVHHNTFLVRPALFWQVGGYDEDYVGMYPSEGPFLRQLNAIAPHEHLSDIVLHGYAGSVVADAITRQWERSNEMWNRFERLFEMKCRNGDERAKNPFRNSWRRLL
jgi:hypothetical protein